MTEILINASGGAASADDRIGATVGAALKRAGVDATIELVDGPDVEARAKAAADRGDALVVVGGGDGTISAAAGALAGSSTRLGLLPLGTLNHFARDLGIPADLDQAAAVLAAGKQRAVDVAELNGRVFVNNSAIGLYPLMVVDRDLQQRRLGRSKRLAMLVAAVRTLVRFGHHRLTLTVNERQAVIDTPLLFVGNNDYGVELGAAGKRDKLDGGELSVLVMRSKGRAGLITASIRALLGRARSDDMVRLEGVERLRVDSRRSFVTVSLDGEIERLAPPLDYRIRKGALTVIAP